MLTYVYQEEQYLHQIMNDKFQGSNRLINWTEVSKQVTVQGIFRSPKECKNKFVHKMVY